MNKDVIKNLIEVVVYYGHNAYCSDSEIIDTLVDCGITEQDFKDLGYWSVVKEYFEND